MTGCQTCGGFGMHHDPVAHGTVNDEPCMCGTPFTCMSDDHDYAVVRIQRKVNEMAEDMAHGARRVRVVAHEHVDGSGEGYCSCGAERCSLPACDGHCVHPDGWVERAELRELRRPRMYEYLCEWTVEGDR